MNKFENVFAVYKYVNYDDCSGNAMLVIIFLYTNKNI